MRFSELAEIFTGLEATSKRLELRQSLSDAFRHVPGPELPLVLYLLQGQLRPEYEGVELGMADSLARRALALAVGRAEKAIAELARSSGDLGDTAESLLRQRSGPPGPGTGELSVTGVYDALQAIAGSTGEGSQEEKVRRLRELLDAGTPLEAKYIVRLVLGKLRLGVKEMTLLDALADAFRGETGFKEARAAAEAAFNVSSDLGEIAERMAEHGVEGLRGITAQVGKPIRPMLAEREASLEDVLERMDGSCALEYKYDGLRLQAHVPSTRGAKAGTVRLFSRRLEDVSSQFPEILAALPEALGGGPAIVEGECVPIDPVTGELRPFQEISRRRGRKYDLERMQEEVPVRLLLFDLLLTSEGPALAQPYPERRAQLERLLRPSERIGLATRELVHDLSSSERFFQQALADGCEGVMAKSLAEGSSYRAGTRGFWWIKYKREYTHELADTIDGVVVGAYRGRGRRAGRYGALLLAAYDPGTGRFPTLCKLGTGFDDATLEDLTRRMAGDERKGPDPSVVSTLEPDVWLEPRLVLEIRGAELTLSPIHRAGDGLVRPGYGFALRFPRFTGRLREDKGPEEATTVKELLRLYQTQVRRMEAPEPGSDRGPPAPRHPRGRRGTGEAGAESP